MTAVDLLLLALVIWLARFARSSAFGLYEDDYTLVSTGMAASARAVVEFEWQLFSQFEGQGRPLQHGLVFLLSFVSGRLGGLRAAYVIAFACVLAATALFYALTRRLYRPGWALLCSLSFAAFPADTTQAFLFHAFGLYQSLIWLCLAFLAYLSGRRWLSHGLALGSLLSYETAYPVFLVAPLLEAAWERRGLARRIIKHGLIMAAVFLAVAALRLVTGEERASAMTLRQLLFVPATHMVQGPFVALGTYAYRPLQVLLQWSEVNSLELLGLTVVLAIVLYRRLESARGESESTPPNEYSPGGWRRLIQAQPRLVQLLVVAIAALALAYPLTFTIRATAISGRATRVHLSAVVGASLVFGTLAYGLIRAVRTSLARNLTVLALSAYVALLVGFGQTVQADYVRSWSLQRAFWSELVPLLPDLDDGAVVLVEADGLQDTRQIDANTWNLQRILGQVYAFPGDWEDPPRVYRLLPDWRETIVAGPGEFAIDHATSGAPFHQTVATQRVILIASSVTGLERAAPFVEIDGTRYELRPAGSPGSGTLARGALYGALVLEPQSEPGAP